jgi:hypothetical protein
MTDSVPTNYDMAVNEGTSDHLSASTSSSSSFEPIEAQEALQIIDEDKMFNKDILDYVNKTAPSSVGNNYHIISVFGSQSTGKSTLLNKLFNTNFDVMNESRRQQTTRGIWMAYSPLISTSSKYVKSSENIFVMDVEGTDGRERGEDQDFERKAALFALSTSEILIVNIWETQVGLYQGANMGLLKTVFEVNLSLFGKNKLTSNDNHKVLLLFVIRDHVGVTPLTALSETLTQDLNKMWDTLNKPADLAHFKFDDFFDVNFHGLPHKVLQPKEFETGVQKLGDRLVVSHELWKPNYHHNIPIDGWTMYADSCWDQIDNNKDLDLPTQQILVAKFKCDEILNEVYGQFSVKFDAIAKQFAPSSATDHQDLGKYLQDLTDDVLENYDVDASRYNKTVYLQRRDVLQDKVTVKLQELVDLHLKYIVSANLTQFEANLKQLKGKNFKNSVDKYIEDLNQDFHTKARYVSRDASYESHTKALSEKVEELVTKQRAIELNNKVNKGIKKVTVGLTKSIQVELADPSAETWDIILEVFQGLTKDFKEKYQLADSTVDFGLGSSEEDNTVALEKFNFKSWSTFYEVIHKQISKESVASMLKDRFDDKFRYDEQGLPRLYQNATELEQAFEKSKAYALKAMPIFTYAKLSDDSEIIPDYNIFDRKLKAKYLGVSADDDDDDDDEDEEIISKFDEILTEQEKSAILSKFKKEIDAQFIETKRSIIQHVTQIPYYIYLVIMVLGWNEFMAIVRNPFFFSLLIVMGAGTYVLYSMNMLKPAMMVVQRLVDECIAVGKEKLREILVDEHMTHGDNLQKISGEKKEPQEDESIELQDN